MRVRWSQLVYRVPGSDNSVGLARVTRSRDGEVLRFCDGAGQVGEEEVGYLALLPLARGVEDELDEWIEVEPEAFLERDHSLWMESSGPEEGFWVQLRALWRSWWDGLFAPSAGGL